MDHIDGQRPRSPGGADPDSSTEIAALAQPWRRLSEQLTPLVGESGFCALFGRALRLSAVRFEGFADCESGRPISELLASLIRILNEIGPEQAQAANAALLDTFTTLLGSLIGEALTRQLLYVAKENVAHDSADGQKHGQEQK